MKIILQNKKTGVQRLLEPDGAGNFPAFDTSWIALAPQLVSKPILMPRVAVNRRLSESAAKISSWGLPLEMSLSAIRWLLGKNCPYCQVGGEFLKLLEDGKISELECKELVLQVLNAKDQKDEKTLTALKGRLEELRNLI